ncbi:AraC family transcriptional regulator [Carboxylicivirga sp. RSCT41]|uniref:helix-turn-helix transcriptional regulator n=1 Tax=Carboxylicivirga agarovorans TaxID=3417570 RepID=UPI003D3327A6
MDSGIVIKDKLEGRLFKVSRFKEVIKRTKPHKHDQYYELIFLLSGEGFHSIESDRYQISVAECFFLKPGQLHYWQFTSIPKGFVLLFKEEAFDSIHDGQLLKLLKQLFDLVRISLQSPQFYETLLELMHAEFSLSSSKKVMDALLLTIFTKLSDELQMVNSQQKRTVTLLTRFNQLISREVPRLKKVHEYAEVLNTTPQNINHICQKELKVSASEVINKQLVLEAKRYILHTDYNMNEIAEFLHFSDSSNFVKFFKKHVGLTPKQYRDHYFQ